MVLFPLGRTYVNLDVKYLFRPLYRKVMYLYIVHNWPSFIQYAIVSRGDSTAILRRSMTRVGNITCHIPS